MIGRRAIVGLSLLSALMFCAFAAQGASAAEKESNNTTAFTCVETGGQTNKDFADEHCDEPVTPGKGKFEHKEIERSSQTTLGATNQRVTNKTTESEPTVLRITIGLSKATITCQKVETTTEGPGGKKTYIENSEPESKVHRITGTATISFGGGCVVTQLEKCTVAEPIEFTAKFVGVDGLIGPEGEATEANAMGIRFKGEGVTEGKEEVFASITFAGAECSLKGQTFNITGSMTATSGPTTEGAQSRKWGGATWVFTPKFKMQNLRCGPNVAELSTILTPFMDETGGKPISTTTPT